MTHREVFELDLQIPGCWRFPITLLMRVFAIKLAHRKAAGEMEDDQENEHPVRNLAARPNLRQLLQLLGKTAFRGLEVAAAFSSITSWAHLSDAKHEACHLPMRRADILRCSQCVT